MNEERFAMAQRTTILRGLVGSTIHGLNVQDGLEDRDEMGVCIEDITDVVGLEPFEQSVYRTAAIREQKHDAKSRAGDLDLTIFSLRKYVRLALKGNPTVLNLLFVPPGDCVVRDARGDQLQDLAPLIVSREAGKAFLGYLHAQRQRLVGERGQKNVNRPELVAAYGFDCYADDTEFLTKRGWLLYDDVADGEAVATVNKETHGIEFQVPTERVAKSYSGDLYEFRHRYSNCLVTPNHRMFIRRADEREKCPNREWRFAAAAEVAGWRDWDTVVSTVGREQDYPVGDALLSVVGAYLSEGCVAKRAMGVASMLAFTQVVGGRLEPTMASAASEYPMRIYGPYSRRARQPYRVFTIANRTLAADIAATCGEGSRWKHLPSWVFDLSKRQANVLLDALMSGDGTTTRTGYRIYYSTSRRLAGDVQALALIAGFRANMLGPYEPTSMYQVLVKNAPSVQRLTAQGNVHKRTVSHARIVCFTVPNETLLTRRNGRVACHGNTKYAMHMLRLGYQGVEIMETGRLSFPMREPERAWLLGVRQGGASMDQCLTRAGELERQIRDLLDVGPIRAKPDRAVVESWMVSTYYEAWKAREPRHPL